VGSTGGVLIALGVVLCHRTGLAVPDFGIQFAEMLGFLRPRALLLAAFPFYSVFSNVPRYRLLRKMRLRRKPSIHDVLTSETDGAATLKSMMQQRRLADLFMDRMTRYDTALFAWRARVSVMLRVSPADIGDDRLSSSW
jgi:hypothetical protein